MGRRTLELEITEAEYPLYTPELTSCIQETYKRHRGDARVEEFMLDAVWQQFGSEFRQLNLEASKNDDQEFESAKAGELTARGRAALLSYIDQAQNFAEALLELDDEQFAVRYTTHFAKTEMSRRARRHARGEKQDRFAFFNLPGSEADFETWRAKPVWTLEEATSLSFGKEPSVVSVQTLSSYSSPAGSPFRDHFLARLDMLTRAVVAKKLSEPLLPAKFLGWARKQGFDLPARIVFPGKAIDDDHLHANTLHHFYRILIGVAMQKYAFDIGKDDCEKQAGVYAALVKDLQDAKLPVSEKTLRSYMRKARAYIATTDLPPAKKAANKAV